MQKVLVTEVGFEPTLPEKLVPKTSALDHSAIQPQHYAKSAPTGARTLDHRLIRPERCQLRHTSNKIMPPVGIEPTTLGL